MGFEQPRVVVVGAGAMGGLFGGLLAEGGLDVTLVDTWREHIAAIKPNGLRIVGVGGDRAIPVKATSDAARSDAADVVLFQCKAFANEAAAQERQAPVRRRQTVAITFQNGLGNEETLGGVLGAENVLGGLTAQAGLVEAAGRGAQFRRPADLHRRDGGRAVGRAPSRSPRPSPAWPADHGQRRHQAREMEEAARQRRARRDLGGDRPALGRDHARARAAGDRVPRASTRRRRSPSAEGVALDVAEAREVLMQAGRHRRAAAPATRSPRCARTSSAAAAPRSTPSTARSRGSRAQHNVATPDHRRHGGDGEGRCRRNYLRRQVRGMDFCAQRRAAAPGRDRAALRAHRADAAREGAGGEARARPRHGARDLREVEGARPLRREHPGRVWRRRPVGGRHMPGRGAVRAHDRHPDPPRLRQRLRGAAAGERARRASAGSLPSVRGERMFSVVLHRAGSGLRRRRHQDPRDARRRRLAADGPEDLHQRRRCSRISSSSRRSPIRRRARRASRCSSSTRACRASPSDATSR